MGAGLTAFLVESVGSRTMILMARRRDVRLPRRSSWRSCGAKNRPAPPTRRRPARKKASAAAKRIRLLRSSRHLQIISLVIAFGAMASNIVDQQVNMAVAEFKGAEGKDAIAAFLGQLIVYLSLIGFVIQVTLTSRIHRVLGIGFALLMLPVSMGGAATLILLNRALWAPSVGRIIDTSIRYTIDKTSREVLFLPLPADLKYRAKPFIDVTMDRFAKGVGAVLMLVCIKDWGLGLDWQQLSYVSLVLVVLWVVTAIAARREYMRSFRRSIEQQIVEPSTRAAQRSRSVVGRDAGQRAGASGAASACCTRSICSTRWTSAISSRRCCCRTTSPEVRARALASRRIRRAGAGRSLAARRRARAEGSGQRRAHRGGVGAGRAARRGGRRRDAAVHHQQRSRARDRRGRGAGRQHRTRPTSTIAEETLRDILERYARTGRRMAAAGGARARRRARTRRSGRCSCR